MSNRKVKNSQTQLQAETTIRNNISQFGIMRSDLPASVIGDNDFEFLKNAISYPTHIEGRTGSRLYSSTTLPTIRSGITAYRDGNTIIRTAGPEFEPLDIFDRYFVWGTGEHDEIVGYTNSDRVTSRQTGNREVVSGCSVRSRIYGQFFHKTTRRIILHIDERLFITNYNIDTWTELRSVSYETPNPSKSYFYEDDEYVFCINLNGVFKINVNDPYPYYYKINSPVPTNIINGVIQTDDRSYGRRYVYANSRLIGGLYHGNRAGDSNDDNVPLLTIEQETGCNAVNEEFRDYGEVFTELPVGLGNETYGVLTCDVAGVGINENLAVWRAINDGTFSIEINGQGRQDIMVDFTNIITVGDIAAFVQVAIRDYFPSATVEIEKLATGRSRFLFTTGKIDGSEISFLEPTGIGTDISGDNWLFGDEPRADLDNRVEFTAPSTISWLIPGYIRNFEPPEIQRHFTHHSVYGSLDTGPDGTDPINGIGNNPERLMWVDDVPIMKAFTASERLIDSPNSLITAVVGLFSQHDIGSTILYQNGETSVIEFLSDSAGNRVYTSTSRWAVAEGQNVQEQSAVLGSSTVLTCSKTGNRVTRESGNRSFNAADVRKPLFWADGTIDWITEFVDGDAMDVLAESEKTAQGTAIDPTMRRFCDVTVDAILRNRIKNYLATHRFHTSLPEANLGVIVPGFLVTAMALDSVVYYSAMATARKYRTGYHNAAFQFDDKIEDDIQFLLRNPDKLVVICSRSTWVTPTNNPLSDTVPEVGISVGLLPNMTLVDNIGVTQTGSIQKIDIGRWTMMTSEPAFRMFDGFRYSDNLANLQIMELLKSLSTVTVSHYDPLSGLIVWGAEEE